MPSLSQSLALGYVIVLQVLYLSFSTGGGIIIDLVLSAFIAVPVTAGIWLIASAISETTLPGCPIEYYMTFKHPANVKYRGKRKISMATFCQMYLDGDVKMNGHTLAVLEKRHDWASFRLTFGLIYFVLFKLIPKFVENFCFHDDGDIHPAHERLDLGVLRGFLGPRMMYTSGLVRDTNKVLSIGYGWEAFANYARRIFPHVPFTSLNHTGEYTTIPPIRGGYKKIICTHLAEHKGPGNFMALHNGPGEYADIFKHIHGLLADDGIFFLEVAGANESWQYEDLVWRLLMAKYVCPDAVPYASLASLINQLETAGFRVNGVENVGRHYSETTFEFFLAYMVVIFGQGSANTYQIVVTKNPSSVDRTEFEPEVDESSWDLCE
ncbi:cyclopropane-fatty-acyl-phospholipid synthase [Colletotrichum simmondsii]|uniref:sphingolipid C(9)-methyltransferase n=1 Tax=Colletotrichum simmondsii TaxID=703756 RepID=A0A135SJ22_9PEZI|nr:cyclopropane-fatty-acyl-phospholipid synthase [Colletotrichum simmondsii]